MKTTVRLIQIISITLLFSNCKSLDKLTQFNIDVSENVTIDPTLPLNIPFDLPTPPIQINSESKFETNNTHKDLIQEIHLTALNLTVTLPDGEDFSILNSIEVYISAKDEPEEKIAWLNPVPNTKTISLSLTTADLKRFILKDNITLKVKTITDEANTRTYKIKIDARFRVNAKILGI